MDTTTDKGKNIALVAYLTLVGSLIAIIYNSEPKYPFASFHIRQGLGLSLIFAALGYPVGYFDSWMVSSAFYLFFVVLWFYGFLGALQGKMNPIPIFGQLFQEWFKSL